MNADGVILGSCIAAANCALATLALRWAHSKSNPVFYGAFFGGMIWKLATLMGVASILFRNPALPAASILISMAVATFFSNFAELKLNGF